MVVDRSAQSIEHSHVRDIDQWFRPGDCLVVNQTKVILAKLLGTRVATGGRWQGLFLESSPDGFWKMLCKTRGKVREGETIRLRDRDGRENVSLTLITKLAGGAWLVKPDSPLDAHDLLDQVGHVPLPHYIRNGNMVDADLQTYQTVFAQDAGSVAAPTAGLHFTEALLERIQAQGVSIARVTLHVGIGTFRPISTDTIGAHQMHEEQGSIAADTAAQIAETRRQGGRVIAVGTTSVRLLESASQEADIAAWQGKTNLFIYPPYTFRTVDAMMTNFHLPKTTLLVLVRTFGGSPLMIEAYRQAIEERYRFFSYGDAMLIL